MDKQYKSIFLRQVKGLMKLKFGKFKPVKLEKNNPSYEILSGSLLYKNELQNNRCIWIVWSPCERADRYFNVYLGWTLQVDLLPINVIDVREMVRMTTPKAGLSSGCLDLEKIEGKNAIGGIVIPSPWDMLLEVKANAKKSEEKVVLEKAFLASEALTDDDRSLAVSGVLDDVFERLNVQILPFINSIEELP